MSHIFEALLQLINFPILFFSKDLHFLFESLFGFFDHSNLKPYLLRMPLLPRPVLLLVLVLHFAQHRLEITAHVVLGFPVKGVLLSLGIFEGA